MYQIIKQDRGLDGFVQELGGLLVEAIMDMEREERSGHRYQPVQAGLYKWAYQKGSFYMGDRKVFVRHPRLWGPGGEIPLDSYGALKKPGVFSEELLSKVLGGISAGRSGDSDGSSGDLGFLWDGFRHVVEVTVQKKRDFRSGRFRRSFLSQSFIDTIHRGGEAFRVALGIDIEGYTQVLGFLGGSDGEP